MKLKRTPTIAAISTIAAVALATSACSSDETKNITGEGSTAQQKAMQHFSDLLAEGGDVTLDYTGSGSGDGIKKFLNADVDFAGSDSPLKPEEAAKAKTRCAGNDAWHLPLVVGPVAIAYNLPGIDNLTLTPTVVADIFTKKITTWNDPKIVALNPGVDLPALAIEPVHRSDSSGTTDNFQKFLSKSAPAAWTLGAGKTFLGQGSGAAKSTGVAQAVQQAKGTVTYVEWGFATQYKLGVAKLNFGSGPVALTAESAGKALDAITFKTPGSKDLVVDSDALFASKAPGAYPLVLTPYSIVCSAGYENSDTSAALKDAFTKILNDGQAGLAELGYVPLPAGYKSTLQGTIDALTGNGGGNA
ncbi:phosphate ABC transporter substrate-binding protein PstS [Gordonia sp. ABSL1-1]|uniref:phosphate ABC transporter substrate-binding protein PstS n=1 Tax=Gordonia sp. ABSL1-1 TaxID=3053923 RepID=UPI00257385A8|nr:phosphate ABC transporter substrate-binding protein PstS [Gordonia sp. ABSL1-1]MDL9936516.1 phosphate ABC transporter substrate-binding protein PstS [Gordonia sp. ABSL1-1]